MKSRPGPASLAFIGTAKLAVWFSGYLYRIPLLGELQQNSGELTFPSDSRARPAQEFALLANNPRPGRVGSALTGIEVGGVEIPFAGSLKQRVIWCPPLPGTLRLDWAVFFSHFAFFFCSLAMHACSHVMTEG